MKWKKLLGSLGSVLDTEIFSIGETPVTVGTLLVMGVIALGTFFIARYAKRAVTRALKRRGIEHDDTLRAARRVVAVLIFLGGLVAALQVVGIDLSTLFAAGAVFAVGIGLAMQSVAQNFVSGIILLVERSIKPEDILEVEGQLVRVTHIGIRAAIARTRDDEELIIPNSTLVQSTVINYTMSDPGHLLCTTVGVVYRSDMKLVRETLENAVRSIPWQGGGRDPLVMMREFGNSSVIFDVYVWIADPWHSRRLLSELNETLWWALKDAGVTIAFPQLDVHFDESVAPNLHLAPSSPNH